MRTKEQEQAAYNGWKPTAIAERWGVHPDTVYQLIESGELRAIRVGANRKAVLHEDLMAYEKANETTPRSDAA